MACASSQLRERIQGLPPEARTLMTDTLGAMARQARQRPQTAEQVSAMMQRTTRQGWSAAAAAALFVGSSGKSAMKAKANAALPPPAEGGGFDFGGASVRSFVGSLRAAWEERMSCLEQSSGFAFSDCSTPGSYEDMMWDNLWVFLPYELWPACVTEELERIANWRCRVLSGRGCGWVDWSVLDLEMCYYAIECGDAGDVRCIAKSHYPGDIMAEQGTGGHDILNQRFCGCWEGDPTNQMNSACATSHPDYPNEVGKLLEVSCEFEGAPVCNCHYTCDTGASGSMIFDSNQC